MFSLVSARSFLPSCFPASPSLAYADAWACSSQGTGLFLTELHEVPVSPFLQPIKVPLDGNTTPSISATPPSFGSSASLLWVHSAPSTRSLNEDKQDWTQLPLVTGLQLDFMPLISTLWAQPFIQFSVHLAIYLASPYSISFTVRFLWETVSKALLKST